MLAIKTMKAMAKVHGPGHTIADPETLYAGYYELLEAIIEAPILGKDYECPHCKGKDAYIVRNAHDIPFDQRIYLVCIEDCPTVHSEKPKRSQMTKVFNCHDAGADFSLANVKLSDVAAIQPKIFEELSKMVMYGHGQVLLAGLTGTGKTYAACAAMNEAMRQGKSAIYVSLSSLYAEWLEFSRTSQARFEKLDKIKEKDFIFFHSYPVIILLMTP